VVGNFLDIHKKLVESIPERIDAATRAKGKYKNSEKCAAKLSHYETWGENPLLLV